MARIRIASTSGASENTIVFSPAGGHSHNGRNSSLIDSTAYSVYDFSPTFVGTEVNPDRAVRQENNRIAFEDLIKRVVNNSVLAPAGIRLEPGSLNGSLIIANTITANQLAANTITADEISAGTITANELSSNIVLVNNRIVSQNWNGTIQANGTIFSNGIGSAGWAITNTHAVFDSTLIRGSVAANSLLTPNLTISNTGAISSTNFNVTAGGNITASNANITGTITSGSGTIGGWTIDTARIYGGSTYLYSNGSIAIGATTIAANGQITNGGYTLSNTGVLTATGANINGIITSTSGTIGGWTINPSSISAGNTALYSNGFISASTGSFTGEITTTSGTIGGWAINGSGFQKTVSGSSSNIYPGGIVLGILTDEVSGDTVLSAARMTMTDENYFSRVKTSGIEIYGFAGGTTSYFKHFGAQLYGGMNLIGGTLTSTAVSTTTCNATTFNGTLNGNASTATYATTAGLRLGRILDITSASSGQDFIIANGNGSGVLRVASEAGVYSKVVTGRAVQVNSSDLIGTTASTARLKQDIEPYIFNEQAILSIEPKRFKYNEKVQHGGDDSDWLYGFIAEEAVTAGLSELCGFDEEGLPDYFAYERMCVAQQQIIRTLWNKVESLESRIQTLEGV
jgi:hypothetical protein